MSLTALHSLLLTAARRRYGATASVGLLSAEPGRWHAWVAGGAADEDLGAWDDAPEGALNALLARINAHNVADCLAAESVSA